MGPSELIPGATAPQGDARDLVVHLARFACELRGTGVRVTPGDEIDAAAALGHVDIGDRDEVRLGLRTSLKIERRAWEVFDAVFERCWGLGKDSKPHKPPGGSKSAPRTWPGDGNPLSMLKSRLAEEQAGGVDQAREADGGRPGYSPRAVLRRKSFEVCTEEELAEMERLLSQVVRRIATRRSRRLVPSSRGRVIDIRRSFRRSLAQGGELVDLARRDRAVERSHVVVLCDTSGSMDPYTRFLLTFVLSLGNVAPRTEIFAFNTSLTRLTPLDHGRERGRHTPPFRPQRRRLVGGDEDRRVPARIRRRLLAPGGCG